MNVRRKEGSVTKSFMNLPGLTQLKFGRGLKVEVALIISPPEGFKLGNGAIIEASKNACSVSCIERRLL